MSEQFEWWPYWSARGNVTVFRLVGSRKLDERKLTDFWGVEARGARGWVVTRPAPRCWLGNVLQSLGQLGRLFGLGRHCDVEKAADQH